MSDESSDRTPAKDPIVEGSLSWHLTFACALLIVSTLWAVFDEVITRRPWKPYQKSYVPAYVKLLKEKLSVQQAKETEIQSSDGYKDLVVSYEELETQLTPDLEKLEGELQIVNDRMIELTKSLKEARSYTSATVYKIEIAPESSKQAMLAALSKYHEGPFKVVYPEDDGSTTDKEFTYTELLSEFSTAKDAKSELRRKLGVLSQRLSVSKKNIDAYMAQNLSGSTSEKIQGLIDGMDGFKYGITSHQIHIADVDLVDRCEVCHLAMRSSVEIAAADMQKASDGTISENMSRAFTSHPKIFTSSGDLLSVHDPDAFGCSTCHGGNGRALTSVEEAHGRYRHWPWPMYDLENTQAGCVQCHSDALHLEAAPTLNRGRQLFQRLACWACHPRDGYGAESVLLAQLKQDESRTEKLRMQLLKEIDLLYADDEDADEDYEDEDYDEDADNAAMEAFALKLESLKQRLSQLDIDSARMRLEKEGLALSRKRPGPNLREIRKKLNKDWIVSWLSKPREFRPSTRMPDFKLTQDESQAIAAFIWQNADDPQPVKHPRGDAARGKETFDTRGCQGCHSIGADPRDPFSMFAADLSRVGEKADYNYLVDWIDHPPEWAIMPDLRLDTKEAQDIAAYLVAQKTDATYASADSLTNEDLFEKGKTLVQHYACYSCHEIKGMENLDKIGTDLTMEGSKPLERLDFALLTHAAKKEGWYSHKGFFSRKLDNPRVFDEGKLRLDPMENLKMPDFGLIDRPEDRIALVTFLLGSVDSQLPKRFRHNPAGLSKDIEQGWWVIKKYNCMGCHQTVPLQTPNIWSLDRYQDEDRQNAPPSLVGVGARLDAQWLAEFLRNPALSEHKTNRNGARMYLDVRMPTFSMSQNEIGKLVRFFGALSKQPLPYPYEKLEPLTGDELTDARRIFKVSKCLSCHVASDDPSTFTSETKAPSFQVASDRLKNEWMRNWLKDPDKVMPNTVMPPLFKEKDGVWKSISLPKDKQLVPDADQVELLVRYMKYFNQAEADVQQKLLQQLE